MARTKPRAKKSKEAPPAPKVFSSADVVGTGTGNPTEQKLGQAKLSAGREPTATERKLAEQGLIPPLR